MTDYTAQILALTEARGRMQLAKKVIAEQVRQEYEVKIQREIIERTTSAEAEFAQALKVANSNGVPGGVIRKSVLRTNDWSVWTYWRDLAEIEPERIVVAKAREAKEREAATYLWDHDARTFTVRKNSDGVVLDPVITYPISTFRLANGMWIGDPESAEYEMETMRSGSDMFAYARNMHAEIQRAIDTKEIEL